MVTDSSEAGQGQQQPSCIGEVEILIRDKAFRLGSVAGAGPSRSLEAEAMRWSYVLRARERWLGKDDAIKSHERDATELLLSFGLEEDGLEKIARADRVVVRMPYRSEEEGWAARVMPWEYLISAATRRHRRASGNSFTVMRELRSQHAAGATWAAGNRARRMLFVQSAPGALRKEWEFSEETERLIGVLHRFEVKELTDPTLPQLHDAIGEFRPDLVHLTGFDNLQGLRALRDLATPGQRIATDRGLQTLGQVLASERNVPDGMLMAGTDAAVAVVGSQDLARALSAGGAHCSYFVGVSLENSAPRTAALIVAERAALSAVGFQDRIDNPLLDFFFELIYTQLSQPTWDLPLAFEQAWLRLRVEPGATRATGVALWAGAPLLSSEIPKDKPQPAELSKSDEAPSLIIDHEKELNYSVLHNNGRLFRQLVVDRGNASDKDWLCVDVELHVGAEPARYRKRFQAKASRFDLTPEVHVPLTASLIRSLQEAVNSTLVVQLTHNEQRLASESRRLRLLPVDQWRDNDRDGQWLPSFALPRDPAVVKAVERAQRYVRVLRDNPTAGFEGYQAVPVPGEESLREVDLQVQAIWATLLHEWQLGYINPPPTYSRTLDSQRLRTPSAVLQGRAGTCIDLALLFAACLELIDVYPVIFLLNGHALPGYWRHHSFQDEYRAVRADSARIITTDQPQRTSAAAQQQVAWQAAGRVAYREVRQLIRARQLAPVETVRLTEHCGFLEAIEAGIEALGEPDDFHSVLDIVTARINGITPLPIFGGEP